MAVALASFKIVNVSISFGLIKLNGLATPDTEPPANGIPSTTINGSLLAFNEAPVRIRIVLPAPGCPPLVVICTPGTLPIMSCSGEEICPF
ncbi:hypothetical protein D3C73_805380 [compost metagenome]